MPASKAQQAITAERRTKALALRVSGANWEDIAAQLGYSDRAAAYKDVERALTQRKREQAAQADLAAALELERLDAMERAAWAVLRRRHITISQGRVMRDECDEPIEDDAPTLDAIDRLLKIQVRRAKLLGLDAPAKVEVITLDAIDREIERLTAELGSAALGAAPAPADAEAGGTPQA